MLSQENKEHYHHYLHIMLTKDCPHIPIPKPRIGQGRARLRRKVKTNQSIPLPQQTPAQPITTHIPKTALPLSEPIIQSQVNVHPQQHMSIPLPQHQLVDPTHIIQPIGHLHLIMIHMQDLHQDLLI